MKKIISMIMILLSMSMPAFAGDISFVEFLGVAREAAKDVTVYCENEQYELDVAEFYKAIDGIILSDIENVPLIEKNGNKVGMSDGIYITVNGLSGYAFISDDCKVDRCAPQFSRLPIGTYEIKSADRAKIMSLFSDSEYNLPFFETPLAGELVRWGILAICVFAVAFVAGFMFKKRKE